MTFRNWLSSAYSSHSGANRSARNKAARRHCSGSTPACVESLEPRQVLAAAATASVSSGVLTIEGTAGRDRIALTDSGSTVFVDDLVANKRLGQWDKSYISRVTFQGMGDVDFLKNATDRIVSSFNAAGVLASRTSGNGGNSDGVLQVIGTNNRDEFQVAANGSDIVVTYDGNTISRFSTNEIRLRLIQINGLGGNDYIRNNVDVPAILNGGTDDDTIYGGPNQDTIYGEGGSDAIDGNGGNDLIQGGADNDTLNGGAGNDFCWGNAGIDVFVGNTGYDSSIQDDNVVLDSTTRVLTVTGTSGKDSVVVGIDRGQVTVRLGDRITDREVARIDTAAVPVDRIEINGLGESDYLRNDSGKPSVIRGGDGDDVLYGGIGADVILGGDGIDTIDGNGGNDSIFYGVQSRKLYLVFDGATMTHNDLMRWAGSDWQWAVNWFDSDNNGVTVTPLLGGRTDREQIISLILSHVQEDLSQYDIQVVRHTGTVIEGQGATTIFLGTSSLTNNGFHIACDIDTANNNRTDIAFVGNENWGSAANTALALADVTLHEAGHTFGLYHVSSGTNPETMGLRYSTPSSAWLANTRYMDQEFSEYLNHGGGAGPQNAHRYMQQTFGHGDDAAPPAPDKWTANVTRDILQSALSHDHEELHDGHRHWEVSSDHLPEDRSFAEFIPASGAVTSILGPVPSDSVCATLSDAHIHMLNARGLNRAHKLNSVNAKNDTNAADRLSGRDVDVAESDWFFQHAGDVLSDIKTSF